MKRFAWSLLGYLILNAAHAASFNCSGSLSAVEGLICSNENLSKQDEALALAYRSAIAISPDKEKIKKSQRTWIRDTRDKCVDQDCILRVYKDRIGELQVAVAPASLDPLADIEGTYLEQSLSCTQYDGEGNWGACPPTTADCLSIKRISGDTAFISVESYQTNGHLCSASGTARIVKVGVLELNKLEYGFIDITSHPVTFDFSSDLIRVDGPQNICGARASWNGVAFAKRSRMKKVISCMDYQNPERYLAPKGEK